MKQRNRTSWIGKRERERRGYSKIKGRAKSKHLKLQRVVETNPCRKRRDHISKDEIISLLPDGPSHKSHNFYEEAQAKSVLRIFEHQKETQLKIPLNTHILPAFQAERTLKQQMERMQSPCSQSHKEHSANHQKTFPYEQILRVDSIS